MPAWVSSLFLRTFDQEITGSSGALGFQIHFVMSFVAPEMVVLSKVLLVKCACACVHTHVAVSFIGGRGCLEPKWGCRLGGRCCLCRDCAESEELYLAEQMVGALGSRM